MKKSTIISISIIAISFILGIYFYPVMPDMMSSRWDAEGQANDYMTKFWALFLMPLISIILFLLFIFIPKIDPLKKNVEKFRKYFDGFIVLILGFLLYIYILTLAWNLGMRFDMVILLMPAFATLFYYCGVLIQNAKRNWFIGIKTPWTLSSDIVWDKTHKLGGKLFKIAGIIVLCGIFAGKFAFVFMMVPILFASIYPIIFSYFEYQKQEK